MIYPLPLLILIYVSIDVIVSFHTFKLKVQILLLENHHSVINNNVLKKKNTKLFLSYKNKLLITIVNSFTNKRTNWKTKQNRQWCMLPMLHENILIF